MPLIQIQALPQPRDIDISAVISVLSQRVATAMNIHANMVWTTWQTIPASNYAEADQAVKSQPADTHPPIVNVIAYEGRSPEMIRSVLTTIAQTLCEELKLSQGNAFVRYTELVAGLVYTAGAVR